MGVLREGRDGCTKRRERCTQVKEGKVRERTMRCFP